MFWLRNKKIKNSVRHSYIWGPDLYGNYSFKFLHSTSGTAHQFVYDSPKTSDTIRVSNSLDPDHDQRSVCPDLGPKCLQSLSAEDN